MELTGSRSEELKHKSRNIKVNTESGWIKSSVDQYRGTYIVPVSEMSSNIELYENQQLKKNLAKFSARKARLSQEEDNEEIEQEMIDISKEVCKIVIDNGPYICATCLEIKEDWNSIESGLYARINCNNCN